MYVNTIAGYSGMKGSVFCAWLVLKFALQSGEGEKNEECKFQNKAHRTFGCEWKVQNKAHWTFHTRISCTGVCHCMICKDCRPRRLFLAILPGHPVEKTPTTLTYSHHPIPQSPLAALRSTVRSMNITFVNPNLSGTLTRGEQDARGCNSWEEHERFLITYYTTATLIWITKTVILCLRAILAVTKTICCTWECHVMWNCAFLPPSSRESAAIYPIKVTQHLIPSLEFKAAICSRNFGSNTVPDEGNFGTRLRVRVSLLSRPLLAHCKKTPSQGLALKLSIWLMIDGIMSFPPLPTRIQSNEFSSIALQRRIINQNDKTFIPQNKGRTLPKMNRGITATPVRFIGRTCKLNKCIWHISTTRKPNTLQYCVLCAPAPRYVCWWIYDFCNHAH